VELWRQRRYAELRGLCESWLRESPCDPRALSLLSAACAVTGDLAAAQHAGLRLVETHPGDAVAHNNLGNIYRESGQLDASLVSYRRAVDLQPGYAMAHYNMAIALKALARFPDAIRCYQTAIKIDPQYADAHYNLGELLREAGDLRAAAVCYQKAVAIRPNFAAALNNLAATWRALGEVDRAIGCWQDRVRSDPTCAEAIRNLGEALRERGDLPGALAWYRAARKLRPDDSELSVKLSLCCHRLADWSEPGIADVSGELDTATNTAAPPVALVGDPRVQLRASRAYVLHRMRSAPLPLACRRSHDRLRLAYLSADFHEHATAFLIAELIELHNRGEFEVIGVSFGPDDGSELRNRIRAGFDWFEDVREKTDLEVAQWLRDRETDIAVDLKGHTVGARLQIFAFRPAPVQVNYLGYPGTIGAPFIDYIIADHVTIPAGDEEFYSERVVRLPDSYQVNDRRRRVAAETPSRADERLPSDAFVFCCFNATVKIQPPVFDCWMRLLRAVPNSCLWLYSDNRWAEGNLQREAAARGVAPERLVFAHLAPNPVHLTRLALADVFLDTLPCNAHTTASDALWAGLPVVTCRGRAFAGRVAASLLCAVGLQELVAESLPEYEQLAFALAVDPGRMRQVRERLRQNRLTYPLFDTPRYCANLESAYQHMHRLQRAGREPENFDVCSPGRIQSAASRASSVAGDSDRSQIR
jgi:predicted O-linked N-acetylglucosamine transferase (SPINDLY family)